MIKTARSIAILFSLTAMASVALVGPASAVTGENGNRSCGVGETAIAHARGRGSMYIKGPGDTNETFKGTSSGYQVREEGGPGGYWSARVTGAGADLDTAGTYSFCVV